MSPSKRRAPSWLDVCVLARFRSELRATGMNLLSGTTWKGAKLRIGEAKPDFRERYRSSNLYGPLQTNRFPLRQNETSPDVRPTKKRRLARGVQGVLLKYHSHGPDCSPNPNPVGETPSTHIYCSSNTTGNNPQKKKRKREKAKLVRARRRTINPPK